MKSFPKLFLVALCVAAMLGLAACGQEKPAETSSQPAEKSTVVESKEKSDTADWEDGSEKVVSDQVTADPAAILDGSAFKGNNARHSYGTLTDSSGLREDIPFLTDFKNAKDNYKYIVFVVRNNDKQYPLMFRINQHRVDGLQPGETKQLTLELKDKVEKNYLFNIGPDAGDLNATYAVYSTNDLPT